MATCEWWCQGMCIVIQYTTPVTRLSSHGLVSGLNLNGRGSVLLDSIPPLQLSEICNQHKHPSHPLIKLLSFCFIIIHDAWCGLPFNTLSAPPPHLFYRMSQSATSLTILCSRSFSTMKIITSCNINSFYFAKNHH